MDLKNVVEPIVELAAKAGAAILEVYATDFDVQAKDDESPLTPAECRALADPKTLSESKSMPSLREASKSLPFLAEGSAATVVTGSQLSEPLDPEKAA